MSSDEADLTSLIEDLSANISTLEDTIQPLLSQPISTTSSKLPLLDKAKLYVLATYALESIIFSALKLNGVNAKEHGVFKELGRVKEYFGKIKAAESGGAKRNVVVDREAAGRMIKHAIGGAGRKRKAEDVSAGTHTRFDEEAKRRRGEEEGDSAGVSNAEISQMQRHEKLGDEDQNEPTSVASQMRGKSDRAPKSASEAMELLVDSTNSESPKERKKKRGKKKKKSKVQKLEDERAEEMK